MTYKVKNIIIGAAAVYLSAEDSTEWTSAPALPSVTGTASYVPALDGSADWRHTGFTSEGVEVSYEPDYGEVEVDQLLDDSTATEETLAIAAGSLGDEPTERSVAFVGPAPRADAGTKRERIYHVRRALSIESSSHSLRRNEATVFPVSFRLLPDPSFSGQEYGVIKDRNIA
jgi:hypothetical protein